MISRRDFLMQGTVLSSAFLLNKEELFSPNGKKELGIQLYTVRDEVKDIDNAFKQLAAAGYTNIEMFGYQKRSFFGKSPAEIKALLKKYKLKTTSGHYMLEDMLYGETYDFDSWKRLMEDARILGQKYAVIPWLDPKHRTGEHFKLIAERLNKAGEISKDAGIITAYHNHDFEFAKDGDSTIYDNLLKATDPNLVKLEMDIYWVYAANQDPIEWFKKHPGRFHMWHVKDMETATATGKGQTCEVGKGIIPWKSIFDQRKLSGLVHPFVEQEQYRSPVFECVKTSADFMKKNLL